MIEDKKRKTRRVSKKVKKMHEEVVSKGIVGAKTGGGIFDRTIYKIDLKKGTDVISSEVDGGMFGDKKLRTVLENIESHPGHHIRIEKVTGLFGTVKVFKIEEL